MLLDTILILVRFFGEIHLFHSGSKRISGKNAFCNPSNYRDNILDMIGVHSFLLIIEILIEVWLIK